MNAAHFQRRLAGLPTLCLVALLCALASLLGHAPAAYANGIVVNSKLDTSGNPSICTLRDAIKAANSNSATGGCGAGALGADTITFSLSGCTLIPCSINLTGGLPTVTQDLTINGGASNIAIDGANLYLIFDLGAVVVNLTNLRIINGKGDFGAAISMSGTTLTLTNVRVAGNHAHSAAGINQHDGALYVYNSSFLGNIAEGSGYGGAIGQAGGIAVIANSTFSGNTSGSGGAVGSLGSSHLVVSASVFDGNSAGLWGGAIYLQDATVQGVIASSTFTNNQTISTTLPFGGGAIRNTQASLVITATTLANNVSASRGGALDVLGGPITLTNVTLSGNSAKDSGGGIFAQDDNPISSPAVLTLNNVTLSDNTADSDNNNSGDGGGIGIVAGTIAFRNSIIAGNFDTPDNAGGGTKNPDCSGIFASPEYTLVGRNDGCAGFVNGSNGNLVGTAGSPIDALLGPLANNGGPLAGSSQPLLTHALLPGSPAINAANPLTPGSGGIACEATDQRAIRRPLGPACDMGAYEAGALLFLPLLKR